MKVFLHVLCAAALASCLSCETRKSDGRSSSGQPSQAIPTAQSDKSPNRNEEIPSVGAGATFKGKPDSQQTANVRKTFDDFKRAVGRYDGKTASALLAKESIGYYDNILKTLKIKVFQSEVYKALEPRLPVSVRTTVDIMANRLSSRFIAEATPRQLYEIAFNQGWIGYESMRTASVDDLRLYDIDGRAYVVADFITAGSIRDKIWARIGFSRENNAWKIDLVPIFVTVQKSIDDYIVSHGYDPAGSIDETVRGTIEASNPSQWRRFVYKRDGFAAKFPRQPLYAEESGWHIYSSTHHRLGQFDVRVRYYDDESALYLAPEVRRAYIYDNLSAIDAKSIRCRDLVDDEVKIVMCNFDVPAKQSAGKTIWYFTQDRVYLLFNIAQEASYDEDAAATFAEGFSI